MKVVGIDLAGSEKRPTGFCILEGLKAKVKILYKNEEILEELKKVKPEIVAIDAPLSLPKGRKSLEEKKGPHLRECDKKLLEMGIKFFPITLGPMRELTKRGIKLKQEIEKFGIKVIEVYPGGAQDLLGISRKKDLEGLRKGLKELGIKGVRRVFGEHELDAITSAFVGKLFLEKRAFALGRKAEGQIIMPKI